MANSSRNGTTTSNSFIQYSSSNGFDPNTTFIQADPSTFRAIVQRLTGADPDKLHGGSNMIRPGFKLHERRPTARKLEIKLGSNENNDTVPFQCYHSSSCTRSNQQRRSFNGEQHMVMVSPVSPLDHTCSPSDYELEEKAIAEKGFYLHPSPLSTPRGSDPPQLLPLFPLHSPRDNN